MCKCLTSQRRTKQKVVTNFATLSKGTSAAARPRAALRQVLFNQGGASDKNPVSEERGQLDVLKQELEAYPVPVSLRWQWKEESQGTTLEKNWTDIVHSHSTMSKMQRHQQEALWEFVHTELTYINKLIIIKALVVAALVNLHQRGFLQEVHPQLLFSNLPSIISAHQLFWQEVIYPMLQEVRRTGQPFDPMRLEAGCLQFPERFSSYQHYCWEEENNLEFTRRQMEGNPHFLTYVQWVETHPQCERMRLGDMQAKPHQRITKYPLLLKAVLRNTQDPHVQHTLRGMLSSVNSFLESINDHLKLKDEELALSISAQRVEGYEVEGISEEIDKNVREICRFDLTCPVRGVGPGVVRRLLLEENLKIRDRKDNKLEVVALLFSDVLLMTKVQKKGERLKVVRPPLALDRTSCIALRDGCSFVLVEVGELQSTMNVYIFTASTSESCSTWVSTVNQAKGTLENLRMMENNRQMENWKKQLETKPIKDSTMDNMVTREQHFVDQLNEETIVPQSINGMLASKEAEGVHPYQPADDVNANNTGLTFWGSQPNTSRERPGLQRLVGDRGISTGRDFLSVNQDARKSSNSQSEDIETSPEVKGFPKNLRSPVLRRRRPLSTNQAPTSRMSKEFSQGSGETWTASSSNSDSDYSLNSKRNSVPSDKSSNSHRVLKLGSLKPNQGMFGHMNDRASPDPETWSEPEPELNLHSKRPKMKTQRSASIPNIVIEGGHGLSLHPTNRFTLPQQQDVPLPIPGHYPNGHPSPLDGLLERAKERRSGRNMKMAQLRSRYPPTSPSLSTRSSPSPSNRDRDTEWEEEVELMRHRALTVSKGWKEQLVDGDEDDNRNSVAFSEGVNVDWPGWCFDDDEVMVQIQPRDEGLLEGISRSLALLQVPHFSEQEEGECSQV
ncbi:unnamed protein product [Pleuronectes platessa]|uniref:DH domain-containing protein n=1 Tax=Pleuronectes platessa TaxID=8262 RepID=A0A9N7VSG6_PLEPL|nr:unnamed protein product [Pleuronectes platessa]